MHPALDSGGGSRFYRRGVVRLASMFGLRGPAHRAALSGVVVPIVPLLPFSHRATHLYGTATVTGNSTVTVLTVPEDQIWDVSWVNWSRPSGVFTISQFIIYDGQNGNLVMDTTNITSGVGILGSENAAPFSLWMYPGDAFILNISSYSSSGDASVVCRAMVYSLDPDRQDWDQP